ncbi:hypothetical protein X947_1700 [Burkholderia pseudomallei MSHR7334]|nr:hypothetical protein X947_1700 [Burkholderia pseudomallei MSHR7334]
MSRLGIETDHGLIYEGTDSPSHLTVPAPIISQCALIESPSDLDNLPRGMLADPFRWIFREDTFDPVSRVRRGRLFQSSEKANRVSHFVEAHPNLLSDSRRRTEDGRVQKQLNAFIHCTELLGRANRGEGLQLAIGNAQAHSLWRILQTEQTVSQDVLVTLRAESAFGILPALNTEKISEEGRKPVSDAYDRVMKVAAFMYGITESAERQPKKYIMSLSTRSSSKPLRSPAARKLVAHVLRRLCGCRSSNSG